MSKSKKSTSAQKADAAAMASEKARNAVIAEIDEQIAKPANVAPAEAKPLLPATPKKSKAAKKPTPAKAAKPAKAPKPKPEKKMSALDAAARVLASAKSPMGCQALISEMSTRGLWTSPGGKTPHATLNAALLREIKAKGRESRFAKAGRGLFAATGVKG